MATYSYAKAAINSDRLKTEITTAIARTPSNIEWCAPSSLVVQFEEELTANEEALLQGTITTHVSVLPVESLFSYLHGTVHPFIHSLIVQFAAENIGMGITQAGKTGHVLSLFTKYYPVPSEQYKNSLKSSLDTGSLYVSIAVLQYLIDHPEEYTDLTPFITTARLTTMKQAIQQFLGIPT